MYNIAILLVAEYKILELMFWEIRYVASELYSCYLAKEIHYRYLYHLYMHTLLDIVVYNQCLLLEQESLNYC